MLKEKKSIEKTIIEFFLGLFAIVVVAILLAILNK